ncbi:transcriptional regulator [Chitinophaga silvatica]|uniref:Transcriptional regulator n=1 Tax=Chitinophaga silvatica TaxID=2282649 RepID=A0A3E1YGR8_9BACT|nr:helix-turn-helix domain-containing protein [Chitinophaga silvatica]RFS26615.1 transcriptional regulator [Chitinophaga silvatica]
MQVPFEQWTDFRISPETCPRTYMLAISDALNVFTGKWKLHIIGALLSGKRRFSEIEKTIPGITPRMLSKELKDLEINGIISRMENSGVEYHLTPSGNNISPILDAMIKWGIEHRNTYIGNKSL